jgi:lipopolysaccharide export system ATP-binding protein
MGYFCPQINAVSLTIQTENLVKKYGNRTVVNQVSFNVKQGEIVGLLGPNGAGKTTSFYQVVGLVKPDEGSVYLNDINITKLPMYKRAQMGIGYLPQEASVFRKLSVEDNISAVLEMTKLKKKEQKEKLETLLDEFRLQHVRKNNGDTLSGGERRRTEIARALAVDPKFVLLDEPFAGVDPIAVEDIQAIVAKLKYKNIGILITDHNVNETLSICDRAYLLIDGKIFKHGTAEQLAEDEQVRRLYLGRNFELKRKDWLLDEGKENANEKAANTFIVDSPGRQFDNVKYDAILDRCINETENKIAILRKFHVFSPGSPPVGELMFPEYVQYLSMVKTTLLNSEIKDAVKEELIYELPDIQHEKYIKILKAFDKAASLSGPASIGRLLVSAIYTPSIRKLENELSEVKRILSEIKMVVFAKNN